MRFWAQLLIGAVLARILTPADYGVLVAGMMIIRFGKYFSDFGLVSALIQTPEIDKKKISTIFTLSAGLGIVFTLLMLAASFLLTSVYNDKIIISIRLLALVFLLNGFTATSQALLRRSLRFKEIEIGTISGYIIGNGIVGISMALLGFGYYSLIYANLTNLLVILIYYYWQTRHSIKISVTSAHRNMIFYGGKMSLINFLNYLGANLDQLTMSVFVSERLLGLYNKGRYFTNLPITFISTKFASVFFSGFSDLKNIDEQKDMYIKALPGYALLFFCISALIIVFSREIVIIFVGQQWLESIPILATLAVSIPFIAITSLNSSLINARDRLSSFIRYQIISIILLGAALLLIGIYNPLYIAICVNGYFMLRFALISRIVIEIFRVRTIIYFRFLSTSFVFAAVLGFLLSLIKGILVTNYNFIEYVFYIPISIVLFMSMLFILQKYLRMSKDPLKTSILLMLIKIKLSRFLNLI